MRRPVAALITSLWFLAAPGLGGVLVPYLLTGWRVGQVPWPVRLAGVALVLLSTVLLALCFARFVTEGSGTPLPSAPTETVLVGGPYRYVRNPMYLAGLGVVLGQALLLGRPSSSSTPGAWRSASPLSSTATRSRCCGVGTATPTTPTVAPSRPGGRTTGRGPGRTASVPTRGGPVAHERPA